MKTSRDTLYFDGQCPICRREIKLIDRLQDGDLALVDIHEMDPEEGPSRTELLEVLHLRTSEGSWVTGVEATVRAWSHTRVGPLFNILRWPLVSRISDKAYNRWAKRRYCNLYVTD